MRNDTGWHDASTARKRAQVQVQKDYEGVQMKSSREQFEEWFDEYTFSAPGRCKNLRSGIGYRNIACQEQWEAWQASRAAIEIKLPRTKYYGDHWSGDWALDPELVVDSIDEAGLKVKS